MTLTARQIQLVSRPVGEPTPGDFAIVERELADPRDGEVLIRNRVMSVDPYMRGRMSEAKSYVPPYGLHEPLTGGVVGEVIASRDQRMPEGALVLHQASWRDYAVVAADRVRRIEARSAHAVEPAAYLGVLGMPGMTAYVGLLHMARLTPGDVVFVSGAAGAVGSLVGQIAKLRGASAVVGSAGSAAKVDYLTGELGFDAAFDYHEVPPAEGLRTAAPDGIDVYFDNVGGDHLEAAIGSLRRGGRVAFCGAIAQYNDTEPGRGPANYRQVLTSRLTIRGFIVSDHEDLRPEFEREMSAWVADGKIRFSETTVEGLDNAVDAFIGLFHGANTGKMIVRL